MKPPQKHSNVIAREIEGETVLLNEEKGEIHQLNQTASFIWQCCNGNNSIDDIIHLLNDKFQTETINIESDVIETLATLKKLNLLEE